jgi:hypothetical protein
MFENEEYSGACAYQGERLIQKYQSQADRIRSAGPFKHFSVIGTQFDFSS